SSSFRISSFDRAEAFVRAHDNRSSDCSPGTRLGLARPPIATSCSTRRQSPQLDRDGGGFARSQISLTLTRRSRRLLGSLVTDKTWAENSMAKPFSRRFLLLAAASSSVKGSI